MLGDVTGGKSVSLRRARRQDAEAVCHVLRNSIRCLCHEDHGNDPVFLDQWLKNKTPEIITEWIENRHLITLVAVVDECIAGVGQIHDNGWITLNYVSSAYRFRGVSKALLAMLEQYARKRGLTICTLESTKTARKFYLSAGYGEIETGECRTGKKLVLGKRLF